MKESNEIMQFREALRGFQMLSQALISQNKKVTLKMNQLENDVISLMERQIALEKQRPAKPFGPISRLMFRLTHGKRLDPGALKEHVKLREVTDEQPITPDPAS